MFAGLIALLLWVIISAFNPIVIKFAIREIPPITLTFFRFLIAAVVLFPIYWRQRPKNITKSHIIRLLFIGVLGTGLNATIFAYGMKFTSALVGQLLYAIVPLNVAIIGFFLIKERITRNQLLGALIGFAGVLFIISQSTASPNIFALGTPLGNGIILASVIFWSFYTVLSRGLSKNYSPITISFFSFLAAVILLGILIPFELMVTRFSLANLSKGLWEILFLGIVASVVIFFLYQFGLRRTSAFITSLTFFLAPVAVGILAVFFLGEEITTSFIVGAILILFGVFLATTYEQLKKRL